MIVSVKHNLIYSLIIIRLATCFEPAGSLSGLHYEPTDIRKLRTFLLSQTMFTKDKHESFVSNMSKTYIAFQNSLIGSIKGIFKNSKSTRLCTQLSNINWFIMKAWWWPRRVETCCKTNNNDLDGWLTVHLSITVVWSPNWYTKFLFIYIQYIY